VSDGLPERLRESREYLGLTVIAMSKKVGLMNRKTWERYEKGDTRPNSDVLTVLHSLGIDANWLLTGEGGMLCLAPIPVPAGEGAAYTLDDRLYDIAIRATLRWYEAAGLTAAPDGLAGMITRAVRMLRGRPDTSTKTDAELAADVGDILDVARNMLTSSGWVPK
jgi:transcriptional regulator with XRE-family HTH domain